MWLNRFSLSQVESRFEALEVDLRVDFGHLWDPGSTSEKTVIFVKTVFLAPDLILEGTWAVSFSGLTRFDGFSCFYVFQVPTWQNTILADLGRFEPFWGSEGRFEVDLGPVASRLLWVAGWSIWSAVGYWVWSFWGSDSGATRYMTRSIWANLITGLIRVNLSDLTRIIG